jgi:hypothetical protein
VIMTHKRNAFTIRWSDIDGLLSHKTFKLGDYGIKILCSEMSKTHSQYVTY